MTALSLSLFRSYGIRGQILMHEDNYQQLCYTCFDPCSRQE